MLCITQSLPFERPRFHTSQELGTAYGVRGPYVVPNGNKMQVWPRLSVAWRKIIIGVENA